MKKINLRKRAIYSTASLLALIAAFLVNSASALYIHNPEPPEELLK